MTKIIFKKILIILSACEYVEQLKLLHIAGRTEKRTYTLESSLAVSHKVKHICIIWLSRSTPGYFPLRNNNLCLQKNYTWILILNCPKLETTQVPFNWQLDKQIIAYWHNEILHKIKKKQSIDTSNNMDRSQKQTNTKDAIYITISKWQN